MGVGLISKLWAKPCAVVYFFLLNLKTINWLKLIISTLFIAKYFLILAFIDYFQNMTKPAHCNNDFEISEKNDMSC